MGALCILSSHSCLIFHRKGDDCFKFVKIWFHFSSVWSCNFFFCFVLLYIYKISALWILLIRLLDFVRIWLIILLFWMFLNWVKECLFYYISGTHWFASLIWKLICRLGCTGIGVGAAYYGVGYVFFFLLKNITWIVNWIIGFC